MWLAKPSAGKHKGDESVALSVLVRDILKLAGDLREVKRIIHAGEILVDGKPVTDLKYGIGLMDIVSAPKAGRQWRIGTDDSERIVVNEIDADAAKRKVCKILGKRTVEKGKTQISLHDGRTLLADGKELKVGDSVQLELPSAKISKHIKLAPGVKCYVTHGKHAGTVSELVSIVHGTETLEAHAKLKAEGREFDTVKKYVFAIGDAL